jgi:L-asparaginase
LPRDIAEIRTEALSNLPSAHFTLDHIWNLSRHIDSLVRECELDGVVVTHGTDTLEESAFLCDLTVDTPKPIVFTGSMRAASDLGYDGLANLAGAIRVAASYRDYNLGTLVVFNDEIHAARDVTKTHTTASDTFQSPELGKLGHIYADQIYFGRKPTRREFIPAAKLEQNVHLLKLSVGMSDGLFEYLVDTVGARGIVLETLGGGRVPPWWLKAIERAIKNHVAVVIASRTGNGRTTDEYGYSGAHRDLVRIGCWFANGLTGQKARIKLMVALGAGLGAESWADNG